MANATDNLKDYISKLPPAERKEVLDYIYSKQGASAIKGMYGGPAPASNTCPTCGRAY
jgi:hypothetical protein